jgi:hypothetical protein
MAPSSSEVKEGSGRMEAANYAVVLRDRIGNDGYDALQEMIRASQENLLTVHHFERRLAEEFGGLRVALAQREATLRMEIREGDAALRQEMVVGHGALRQEMVEGHAALRQEMVEGHAALRQEMVEGHAAFRQEMVEGQATLRQEIAEGLGALRREMAEGHAALRQEILASRFEVLKWSFIFWVGQAFTVAAIVGIMLQLTRP